MIYIIGDSHVSVFSGTDTTHDGLRHIQPEFGTCYTLSQGQLRQHINRFEQRIPQFCPIKIGSNTAYNSFNKLSRIEQAISEYGVGKDDYVFLCFGEIDIRNHIGFNIKNTLEETIKNCVDRYMETVLYLKNKDINIGVYAPPCSSVGNKTPADYGDVILRNSMTLTFNEYLTRRCDEYDIPIKNIAALMMLPDGTTDETYIMDDIHLSQKAMPLLLKEFSDIICKVDKK
jgi:lysophospholipase L1-like esterase